MNFHNKQIQIKNKYYSVFIPNIRGNSIFNYYITSCASAKKKRKK